MKLKPNPYWICQITGWSLYAVSGIIMTSLITGTIHVVNVFANITAAGIFFTLSHIGRNQFNKFDLYKKSFKKIILSLVVFVITASTIGVTLVFTLMMLYEGTAEGFEAKGYIMSYINALFTFSGWASFYSVYKLFNNYKNKEINQWKLEAKVLDTELKALIYQMNPHLLFNSLNNIRSLISSHPEKAREATTALSKLLRVSLNFDEEKLLPIQNELAITKDYLNLEKITHEENLIIDWDIAPIVQNYYVPSLGIQTIVENAIKHGTPDQRGKIFVSIDLFEEDEELIIRVKNPGNLAQSKNEGGVGLKNLIKRLDLFNIKHQFSIKEIENNFVETELIIETHENYNSRRFKTSQARIDQIA